MRHKLSAAGFIAQNRPGPAAHILCRLARARFVYRK